MKRIILFVVSVLLFITQVNAEEVKLSFDKDFKQNSISITSKKNDIINLSIYFNSLDYDLYNILADFSYDKNHLELLNYKGNSDFNITIGNKILADRIMIDKNSGKVLDLSFKSLKSGKTTINLKNINIGNLEDTKKLNDIKAEVKISNDSLIYFLLIPSLIIIVVVSYYIYLKKKGRR